MKKASELSVLCDVEEHFVPYCHSSPLKLLNQAYISETSIRDETTINFLVTNEYVKNEKEEAQDKYHLELGHLQLHPQSLGLILDLVDRETQAAKLSHLK